MNCEHVYKYCKEYVFTSNPPKYRGQCVKCKDITYTFCSEVRSKDKLTYKEYEEMFK